MLLVDQLVGFKSQWSLLADVWNVFFCHCLWLFVGQVIWPCLLITLIKYQKGHKSLWLPFDGSNDFVTEWTLRVIIYTIDNWQLTFTRDMSWPQKPLNGSNDIARFLILLTIDNWLLAKCGLVPNYENDTTTPWCEAFWLFECTLLTSDNWPWFFLLLMFIFLLGLNICITLLTARSSFWSKMSQRVTGEEEQGSVLVY